MSKFPRLSGTDVITALGKVGFVVTRIKGSHHQLRHLDGRATTVPIHGNEPIGVGLMSKILRDCQLTREEFLALL